jgi:hypothetical protein
VSIAPLGDVGPAADGPSAAQSAGEVATPIQMAGGL